MKNKVYKSLNDIFPSDSQKKQILQNIMKPKEKIGGKIFTLATISICLLFTFILFNNENNGNKDVPLQINAIRLSNDEFINYKNDCYELTSFNGIKFGKKIDGYRDYEVYKIDGSTIALVKQDVHKMYRKCERN